MQEDIHCVHRVLQKICWFIIGHAFIYRYEKSTRGKTLEFKIVMILEHHYLRVTTNLACDRHQLCVVGKAFMVAKGNNSLVRAKSSMIQGHLTNSFFNS